MNLFHVKQALGGLSSMKQYFWELITSSPALNSFFYLPLYPPSLAESLAVSGHPVNVSAGKITNEVGFFFQL